MGLATALLLVVERERMVRPVINHFVDPRKICWKHQIDEIQASLIGSRPS